MIANLLLPFKEPKLWIFDLDGTLLDTKEALDKVIQTILKEFNIPFDRETVDKYHSLGTFNLLRFLLKRHPKYEKEALFYAKELYKTDEYLGLLRTFDTMIDFVKEIKKKCPVAIATNRGKSTTRILEHFGISPLFDMVVHSDITKNIKPHPEMLEKILKKFSLDPSLALFVGNDWPDLQAAVNAKIPTLIIQKNEHEKFKDVILKKGVKTFIKGLL
jgi:beta-phosphoglucomutase-like phosphatase (HAD superfamily)